MKSSLCGITKPELARSLASSGFVIQGDSRFLTSVYLGFVIQGHSGCLTSVYLGFVIQGHSRLLTSVYLGFVIRVYQDA